MKQLLGVILGYENQEIAIEVPIMELGADSLMIVEARTRLAEACNLNLPASFLFNYPTIEKATDYILSEIPDLKAELKEEILESSAQELLTEIDELLN